MAKLKNLGRADVYRDRNGNLIVDERSIGGDDDELGYDDVGDDDIGDDDIGDDDVGDDDIGDDEVGARHRRGPGRRGPGGRRRRRGKSSGSAYTLPTSVSAQAQSSATLAAAGTETETLTLTPTVSMKLEDLRITIFQGTPATCQFLIQQIRIGDDLRWNDTNGVDATNFAADATLKAVLKGAFASPAQPIYVQGQWINRGGALLTVAATVSISVIAKKKPARRC